VCELSYNAVLRLVEEAQSEGCPNAVEFGEG